MNIVLNLNDEFYFASLFGVFHLSVANLVASQLKWKAFHEIASFLVVNEQVHAAELVFEREGFSHGEARARGE